MDSLRETVFEANAALARERLITLTWGNVSGIDRERGLVAIKPSGVPYDRLRAEDMVLVALDGRVTDSRLRPSSDTPTHLELYKAFPGLGGVCHTHSLHATAFAQACREIPCLGTTHADVFYGAVPLARPLGPRETAKRYEINTGRSIVERFETLDAEKTPGVLCAHHGPFTWGASPALAVENAVALEALAAMAIATLSLNPQALPLPTHIMNTHYFRKHGRHATYGQDKPRHETSVHFRRELVCANACGA